MTRTRTDVWEATDAEGPWPAVLTAYEQAVGLMRSLDPPTGPPTKMVSWQFMAAIHGRARSNGQPDTGDALWNNCQHGSWFFLAWHRMYLLAFEAIIQSNLGDDTWSLPYWFSVDPDDPDTSILPPAFRDTKPGNNLFTQRRSLPANGGQPLPDLSSDLTQTLEADTFSTPAGTSTFGGGERSDPSFNGNEVGLLENVPHGAVHSLVGNDYDSAGNLVRAGWMGSFYTAGLDPIFWLHHCNIDRLWQVWLDEDPSHTNPPANDPAWTDTEFTFPAPGGGTTKWKIGDVLDTVALGYTYENLDPPSTVTLPVPGPAGPPNIGLGEAIMPPQLPPQVVGATNNVPLTGDQPIEVTLSEPSDLGLALDVDAPATGARVYLRLEGITGTAGAPVYAVYVNVPAGERPEDHPDLLAGRVSTFGVPEASQSNDLESGSGLTKVLEITAVRDTLADRQRWNPAALTVTFSPVIPSVDAPGAEALARAASPRPADIRASRISVVTT